MTTREDPLGEQPSESGSDRQEVVMVEISKEQLISAFRDTKLSMWHERGIDIAGTAEEWGERIWKALPHPEEEVEAAVEAKDDEGAVAEEEVKLDKTW